MSDPNTEPTIENPRPGVSKMEMLIFYLNCVVKALSYYPFAILSLWLSAAGWNSWYVAFAWSMNVAAKTASGPILGWCSDGYKVRIPLLSFSALVVGICDIFLPDVLVSQSVWVFGVIFFVRSFFTNALLCSIWIADWLPHDVTNKSVQSLNLIISLTHALSCMFGVLLYDSVGASNIFKGYGVLSLVSALSWWYHRDNALGMYCSIRKSCDGLAVMDGPIRDLLPEKGWFLLGWPLFAVCLMCLTFEAIAVAGIYSVGILYITELGVQYSSIAFTVIIYLFLILLAQILLKVLSCRVIATFLVSFVVASGLPKTLGVGDGCLLIIFYGCIFASNNFIWTIIASLRLLMFDEAWKARMTGLFQILRESFELAGICIITAVYEYNKEWLIPSFIGCSLLVYVFFIVASFSLPPKYNKSEDIAKLSYSTLKDRSVSWV